MSKIKLIRIEAIRGESESQNGWTGFAFDGSSLQSRSSTRGDDDYLFRSSLSDYFYSFISFFDWRPSFFIASIIYTITKIVSILYLSFQSHYAYCIMTFWRWRKEKWWEKFICDPSKVSTFLAARLMPFNVAPWQVRVSVALSVGVVIAISHNGVIKEESGQRQMRAVSKDKAVLGARVAAFYIWI